MSVRQEVWKFELYLGESSRTLEVPGGWVPLSIQWQGDQLYLWALVAPDSMKVSRTIRCFGTGQGLTGPGGSLSYIDTVQDDSLVWHFFEATTAYVI